VLDGKSLAAKEFVKISKKLAGLEVAEPETGRGFFSRIGRALGLSPTPA
jgi:hypothetical protein